ncbi:MAG: hypothetical protein A3E85_04785 [Gammaproteobacteria bacterium RIFCSPHIGHO2_12_FULL_45_12]|nr:MAG: hypothetical protein A3E85_04785 [Gammaproteobacteria bacterium RIFCSPHIGHO2_12_FULL_45_12]
MSRLKLKQIIFPLLLVLYEISTYLSNDMYLPALPDMMRDLHITTQQVQLTLMIWFAGLACTPLIFGALSDRFGRRPVLLLGGLVYVIASAACALATDFTFLLWVRFIQGCAIPTMMVAGYASIHELYDHKEAINILALMSAITILAPAFGPLLGAIILYVANWRDIFWVITIWSSLTLIFLFYYMPETHAPALRHPIQLPVLFKSYWRVITNKAYMLQMCILGCLFGGFIVWISSGSLLVMESFHFTAMEYGLFQIFVFAFYFIGNLLVDPLMDTLGIDLLIRLGLSIGMLGAIFMSVFAVLFPQNIYPYILALSFFSFGTALCFAPLNRMIIEASDEPMGIRVAFFTVFLMLALAIVSYIGAHIYNGTILSVALITTLSMLTACLLKRFTPKSPPQDEMEAIS